MRPVVVVIAGPNGSGKTTLTDQLRHHQWLNGCAYINPDMIARDEFGSWNDPAAVVKAARRADEIRDRCLSERRSMAFETVFSTARRLTFLSQAKAEGFFIRLFYVGTSDFRINISRVARRVSAGGHDVPVDKIAKRYASSLALLPGALAICDRGYVYDNSIDDAPPRLLFRSSSAKIVTDYGTVTAWARPAYDSIK